MVERDLSITLAAEIVEDDGELSLADLCQACELSAGRIVEFVEEGVIEPIGREPAAWRFRAISVRRVRCAQRLEQDLGVNTAGVALALELLEELEQLRSRLRRLQNLGSQG